MRLLECFIFLLLISGVSGIRMFIFTAKEYYKLSNGKLLHVCIQTGAESFFFLACLLLSIVVVNVCLTSCNL